MDINTLTQILGVIESLVVIGAIPVGLYQFIIDRKQAREAREYLTYNALDEKYHQFLQLCFDHPELNIFDVDTPTPEGNAYKEKQEEVAFTMLISIFERAYLMYRRQANEVLRRQWRGWERYMYNYAARPNFRQAWFEVRSDEFDSEFCAFMDKLVIMTEGLANLQTGDAAENNLENSNRYNQTQVDEQAKG